MQNDSNRLKTQGSRSQLFQDLNLQKYGEQLKSQLEHLSRKIMKKKTLQQQSSTHIIHKKQSYGIQKNNQIQNEQQKLEESIVRKNKDQEKKLRRNMIYKNSQIEIENQVVNNQNQIVSLTKTDKNQSQSFSGLSISDFILGKKLGQGKFGQVFVAKHKKTGFVCAIKRIFRSSLDNKMVIQLVRQIKIQAFLNHPNIVKLYTFFSDKKAIYLIQQLCISGQLYTFLTKKRKISQELVKVIIQQICRALDFMHECQIIHRDIKPQNIIFHNGLVKICDFGWSVSSKAMRQTFCGTPLYISPELLKQKRYNNKVDVWGLGILAYQLLFGRVPFEIVTQKDFIKIIDDEIRFSKTISISSEAKEFIVLCLTKNPRDRYTIPELLEHPFIARIENPVLSQLY